MSLEMNLFIDPLKIKSYEAEKEVLRVAKDVKQKIVLNFIPIINIKTIHEFNKTTDLTDVHYKVVLDMIAASFQGKKFGRSFLMKLQEEMFVNQKDYSDELANQVVLELGLDLEMFLEDHRSELAIKHLKKDQQYTNKMVKDVTPSMIVFDTASDDAGILIKDFNYQTLRNFCEKSVKKNDCPIRFITHTDFDDLDDSISNATV